MHFQDLFYFSEAVKCGNISKAAKELQVSRQTITATLSRLEKEIGYPLLIRSKNGIELNDEGRMFFSRIDDFFQDGHQIMQDMVEYGSAYRLPLRIGVTSGVEYPVYRVLDRFREENERVDLSISFLAGKVSTTELLSGRYDVVISLYQKAISPRISVRTIAAYPACVAVHRENPLSSKKSIRFADLEGERILSFVHDLDSIKRIWERNFSFGPEADNYFYSEDAALILSMLAQNAGIVLCHPTSVIGNLNDIVLVPLAEDYSLPVLMLVREDTLENEKYSHVLLKLEEALKTACCGTPA